MARLWHRGRARVARLLEARPSSPVKSPTALSSRMPSPSRQRPPAQIAPRRPRQAGVSAGVACRSRSEGGVGGGRRLCMLAGPRRGRWVEQDAGRSGWVWGGEGRPADEGVARLATFGRRRNTWDLEGPQSLSSVRRVSLVGLNESLSESSLEFPLCGVVRCPSCGVVPLEDSHKKKLRYLKWVLWCFVILDFACLSQR